MSSSFAIMAVPFGTSTTFAYSLTDGQCVTVLYGWIFVSIISLMIAASLAEICAVYPTAGGVYYWSAMLSTKKYAPVVSWVTGWLTLVGNWTVTLSINFSGAQLILSAITLWNEDYVATQWQVVLCFWGVMMIAFLVNVFGAKRKSNSKKPFHFKFCWAELYLPGICIYSILSSLQSPNGISLLIN